VGLEKPDLTCKKSERGNFKTQFSLAGGNPKTRVKVTIKTAL